MQREAWIGQVLTLGVHGTAVSPELRELSEYIRPGGYIYFKRNVAEPETLRAFSDELQKLQPEVPAFIGLDQEGGTVARLRAPFTEFPGNRTLGMAYREHNSTEAAERQAEVFARELQLVGCNWDFAPVLDVDSNPDNPVIGRRAFSSDPDVVARLGVAFAQSLEQHGVLSCGKHVPGHGNTRVDSHLDLPVEETSPAMLRQRELQPFAAYSRAGLAALMTAHVVYTQLDPERPATLSPRIIQELVRGELDFRGLVVTDDMEMKAIDDRYGIEQSTIEAVVAGCDVILICHTPEKQQRAIEALREEDRKSRVVRNRLDQALGRIMAAKKKFRQPAPFDPSRIATPEALRLADQLRNIQTLAAQRDPTEYKG